VPYAASQSGCDHLGVPMSDSLDLDAYFERIHWGGATTSTFPTLAGLLRAHLLSIPFENFDVLLGRGIRLDLDGVQAKLVRARRGGYCFEHATLFAAVLEKLGFQTVRHTARVIVFAPIAAAPRTHMFLTVRLPEGTFVVDPGFGPFASRIPIPLIDGAAARGDYETHWMIRDGNRWTLRAELGGKSIDAWVTTLEPDQPVDFEMGNYYTASHPNSLFVNRLIIASLNEQGRVTAMNRDANLWRENTPCPTQLADRPALRALLIAHFGFDLPEVERLKVPTIPEWR
jgi:N-hydroxyarylamine O-acetyltransferase